MERKYFAGVGGNSIFKYPKKDIKKLFFEHRSNGLCTCGLI